MLIVVLLGLTAIGVVITARAVCIEYIMSRFFSTAERDEFSEWPEPGACGAANAESPVLVGAIDTGGCGGVLVVQRTEVPTLNVLVCCFLVMDPKLLLLLVKSGIIAGRHY